MPDRHLGAGAGHGLDPLAGLRRREERLQLQDVLRELLGGRRQRGASARSVGWSVPGARPRPRSMRSGEQRGQRAELLGDDVAARGWAA